MRNPFTGFPYDDASEEADLDDDENSDPDAPSSQKCHDFRCDPDTQEEIPHCPKCQSSLIEACHRARKIGGTIGTVAGTTGGIAFALSGAEAGATVGLVAGPAGAMCGAIAGAVIAGLICGAAGCATGSVFGEIVDEKVLDNFRCHACGHTFSRSRPAA